MDERLLAKLAKLLIRTNIMERKEAAEFLGVSLRTLDRLSSERRLTKGRALKKTRPVVVFQEDELATLKKELAKAGKDNKVFRRLNTPPRDTVAFRLDPHYLSRLLAEGEARGMSAGEVARSLVIRGLEDSRADDFGREVRRLRESLASTFLAFLTMKCEVPMDEAERFVAETILRD